MKFNKTMINIQNYKKKILKISKLINKAMNNHN